MASQSLHSASAYLNNLLLARGLLNDGKSINFAEPTDSAGSTDATMSRIINLVHDLVLRRDRDSDQREALANSLRTARVEEGQRVLDLQRAQEKNGELTRDLTNKEARARGLQAMVRRADAQAKELKEQMLKMKSTLDQVRAKCVNDVRKRDKEIEKLKNHVIGLQRGKREVSGMKINVINPQAAKSASQGKSLGNESEGEDECNLEQETNDFLAALVNETSTENVTLRNLIGGTIATLKELTGLDVEADQENDREIGIPGQYRNSRLRAQQTAEDVALISCATLAANLETVMGHCRTILKDPSFVPIEEVAIRDEEIIKLREGWEKMAGRWKEAVTMMDTWRRRMQDNGKVLQVDELAKLNFGRSIATMPNGQPVLGQEDEDLSSLLYQGVNRDSVGSSVGNGLASSANGHLDNTQTGGTQCNENTISDDDESELDIPAEQEQPPLKRLASSPARRGIRIPRPTYALEEINGNVQSLYPSQTKTHPQFSASGDSGVGALDGSVDSEVEEELLKEMPRSRIPRQTKENGPPLSMPEKLAAIESEARVAEQQRQQENPQKRKQMDKPSWRKASRRRSTLSPEELAALMGVR